MTLEEREDAFIAKGVTEEERRSLTQYLQAYRSRVGERWCLVYWARSKNWFVRGLLAWLLGDFLQKRSSNDPIPTPYQQDYNTPDARSILE